MARGQAWISSKKKEGFPRCDLLSEQHLQVGADTRRPEITIEQPAQGRITLQIHQSKGFKTCFYQIP